MTTSNTAPKLLPETGTLIIGGLITNAALMVKTLQRFFPLQDNPWKGHTPGKPLQISFARSKSLVWEDYLETFVAASQTCGGGYAWRPFDAWRNGTPVTDFYWRTPERTYDVFLQKEDPTCPDYQGFMRFMNTPHIVETAHKTMELTL